MSEKKGLREIISGSIWVFLGLIIGYLSEYIIKILIARFYGVKNYGEINLCLTFSMMIISFSLLGLHIGIAKYIANYDVNKDKDKIILLIKQGLYLIFFSSLFFSLLFFWKKDFILLHFFKENISKLFLPFIILIPLATLAEYFYSCLRGLKLAKYAVFSKEFVRRFVIILFLLIFIKFNKDIFFVALSYLFGFLSYLICSLFFTTRKLEGLIRNIKINTIYNKNSRLEIVKVLKFSFPLIISFVIIQIGEQMSNLFLGYYYTSREIGLFSAALPFSRLISLPLTIILFMFLPVMSNYWKKGYLSEINFIFKIVCKVLFLISGLLFIFFVFYAKLFITYSFGKNFILAYKALIILSIGQFFNTICGPTGGMLLAMGLSRKYFLGDFLGFISSLFLYWFLVPRFSFVGAAFASIGQMFIINIIRLYFLNKELSIFPFQGRYFLLIIFLLFLLFIYRYFYPKIHFIPESFFIIFLYSLLIYYMKVLNTKEITTLYEIIKKKIFT